MSEELEKRLLDWADFLDEGDYSYASDHARDDREAAAELKAQRTRLEFADRAYEAASSLCRDAIIRSEQAEAARDKALADVERLRRLLDTVRERCLFADDDGGVGVTEDAHIDGDLFNEICGALKETLGEQDD